MLPFLITIGVLVALTVLVVMIVAGMYNKLVTLRNRFENAFSQIDVQLKRRYDLIPNLVETAKAYMAHESETLEAVIKARNIAAAAADAAAANPGDAKSMSKLANAEGALSAGLGRLMMVSEQYPDLKANQNMMQLSEELTSTENRISFARQAFNDSATAYNTKREIFPTNIIAGMFNFAAATLFEIEDPSEKEAPQVSFS